MKRLLADFEAIVDLDYRVGGVRLGQLVEDALDSVGGHPLETWGSAGPRNEVASETEGFVSFYYRPHLFPEMDLRLRLAHELQFHLLPRDVPPGAPVTIASVLESYCHLSGDLFGWEMMGDGTFLMWIVDMSGHGVRAGLTSAILKLLINHSKGESGVDEILTSLNRSLHDCLRPESDTVFATAFLLAVDSSGAATYGSAGHPPVLLKRAAGDIEELGSIDIPLGLFGETTYESRPVQLRSGDMLLLYTDGVIETRGNDGQEFGLDRLRRSLSDTCGTPENLTGSIYRELVSRQDIDKLDDDVTFLAVKIP